MEYSFRNSVQGNIITITINDVAIVIGGTSIESVRYEHITEVRMTKSASTFKVHLFQGARRVIVIPSQSFSTAGTKENRSREYSLFIRVLHHHLSGKSKAIFRSGKRLEGLWQKVLAAAGMSLVISMATRYWGPQLINPYFQTLVLTVLASTVMFVFSIRRLPKCYHPTSIPLQFLP